MAFGSATVANNGLLKPQYQKGLSWRALKNAKFYNMVRKDQQFTGKNFQRTIALTAGNGGSPDFVTALALRGPGSEVTFTITRGHDYVILSISRDLFTGGDANAIASVVKDQMDRKLWEHGTITSRRVWGANGGKLGRLIAAAAISGTTVTLLERYMVEQIYPGNVVEFATTTGTAPTDAAVKSGSLTVASTDPAACTVTFTEAVTTGIPTAANSDYVSLKGEHANTWSGVLGWCPVTAPTTGVTFYGVDRYAYGDANRISGFRPSITYPDITDNVMNALAEANPLGVEVDTLFINPKKYAAWLSQVGDAPALVDVTARTAHVSYKALVVHTPAGEVRVMSEARIPESVWVATDMDTWTLMSNGPIPRPVKATDWETEAAADAVQARLCSYPAMDNKDPGNTVVGSF